jgi:glycosyltransferase involved in cell wall biosynthesis
MERMSIVPSHDGITLGLVTRNRPRFVENLLSTIFTANSRYLVNIIVYDSSENDETWSAVRRFPSMLYLRGRKRLPGGRNEILRRVRSSLVCYLDDDIRLYPRHFDIL